MSLRLLGLLATLFALGACGVDGEPERPEPRPEPGISITGSVGFGLVDP